MVVYWLEAQQGQQSYMQLFLRDSIRKESQKKCSLGIQGGGSEGKGDCHIDEDLRFWESYGWKE